MVGVFFFALPHQAVEFVGECVDRGVHIAVLGGSVDVVTTSFEGRFGFVAQFLFHRQHEVRIVELKSGKLISQAALEEALRYARGRTAFGQPIGNFQAIQFQLADIATELEAARMLTWKAADTHDRAPRASLEAAMAKLFASEVAERVCSLAIQTLGGYGVVNDFPVERIYRDVRVCQIYEGTSDVQKIIIQRAL